MAAKQQDTRLGKLLNLLQNAQSADTRKAAARQICEVAKTHPSQLPSILRKVQACLCSKSWDARVAAGEALGLMAEHFQHHGVHDLHAALQQQSKLAGQPVPHLKDLTSSCPSTMADFNLKKVLENGSPLLASGGQEFDLVLDPSLSPAERIIKQKKLLKQALGGDSAIGQILDKDIVFGFGDEDIAAAEVSSGRKSKGGGQTASNLLQSMSGLSARERNRLKRHAKAASGKQDLQRAASSGVTSSGGTPKGRERRGSMDVDEGRVPEEVAVEQDLEEWRLVEAGQWPFVQLCDRLCVLLLDPLWEVRHGAAVGLREILRSQAAMAAVEAPVADISSGWCCPGTAGKRHLGVVEPTHIHNAWTACQIWLQDLIILLLSVLALDRFGDYISDQVTAPVRETAAQVLGYALTALHPGGLDIVMDLLLQLRGSEEWEVRHGGMLGIKYLLAAAAAAGEVDVVLRLLPRALPQLLLALGDNDDDVRAAAADALLPVAAQLLDLGSKAVYPTRSVLWNSLSQLRELSSATSNVMQLLALLYADAEAGALGPELTSLVPRMLPFMHHALTSVRLASVSCLRGLLDASARTGQTAWVAPLLELLSRLLFQNVVVEADEKVVECSIQAWQSLMLVCNVHQLRGVVSEAQLRVWVQLAAIPANNSLPARLLLAYEGDRLMTLDVIRARNGPGPRPAKRQKGTKHLSEEGGDSTFHPWLESDLIVGPEGEGSALAMRTAAARCLAVLFSTLYAVQPQLMEQELLVLFGCGSGAARILGALIMWEYAQLVCAHRAVENQREPDELAVKVAGGSGIARIGNEVGKERGGEDDVKLGRERGGEDNVKFGRERGGEDNVKFGRERGGEDNVKFGLSPQAVGGGKRVDGCVGLPTTPGSTNGVASNDCDSTRVTKSEVVDGKVESVDDKHEVVSVQLGAAIVQVKQEPADRPPPRGFTLDLNGDASMQSSIDTNQHPQMISGLETHSMDVNKGGDMRESNLEIHTTNPNEVGSERETDLQGHTANPNEVGSKRETDLQGHTANPNEVGSDRETDLQGHTTKTIDCRVKHEPDDMECDRPYNKHDRPAVTRKLDLGTNDSTVVIKTEPTTTPGCSPHVAEGAQGMKTTTEMDSKINTNYVKGTNDPEGMNDAKGIKHEVKGIKQEVKGIKPEVKGVKQEVTPVKSEGGIAGRLGPTVGVQVELPAANPAALTSAVVAYVTQLLHAPSPSTPSAPAALPYVELTELYKLMRKEMVNLIAESLQSGVRIELPQGVGIHTLPVDIAAGLLNSLPENAPLSAQARNTSARAHSTVHTLQGLEIMLHSSCCACLASALVLTKQLPAKLNVVIQPLMNCLRREGQEKLQEMAAKAIAEVVVLCQGRKPNPTDKIVRNMCSMLCADLASKLATSASGSKEEEEDEEEERRDAAAGPGPGSLEDPTALLAFTSRRGAHHGLKALSTRFQAQLLQQVPSIWEQMSGAILLVPVDDSSGKAAPPCPDPMVPALASALEVVCVAGPLLHTSLVAHLLDILPGICYCWRQPHPALRGRAAACVAALAQQHLSLIMPHVLKLLTPSLKANAPDAARLGGVQVVTALSRSLGMKLVTYVMLLVVPLLALMSDAQERTRRRASACFAGLLPLLPLAHGLPPPPGLDDQQLQAAAADSTFLQQLLDNKRTAEFKIQAGLINVELRPYQQEGINWLGFLKRFGLHGVLADDMGLGKTLQTIAMLAASRAEQIARFKETGKEEDRPLPSLVVCPQTLVGHWAYEIERFADNTLLHPLQYVGNSQERMSLRPRLPHFSVCIMSYESLRSDAEWVAGWRWLYCVLDEGHIIRNPTSKMALACKRVNAQHRLLLSGTPIQNNVLELWSLFDFLMPGFLGSLRVFKARYGKAVETSKKSKKGTKESAAGVLALEALHKQVMPFVLRRTKQQVLHDLPPKIIQDVFCDPSAMQLELHGDLSDAWEQNAQHSGTDTSSGGTLAMLTYLRKLCSHPLLVLDWSNPSHLEAVHKVLRVSDPSTASQALRDLRHAPKLLALRELLVECGIIKEREGSEQEEDTLADGGHRVLIFAQMKAMLDLVERDVMQVDGVSYLRLDGSTEASQRFGVAQRFNSDPTIDVLLLTTQVGGLGLNLTSADTVIFLEHDWNPQRDLQAMDRAHRLGQKRCVSVYRLIVRGTLEEKIMGLQQFKLNMANTVVNQDNMSMATMDTSQLLDLFAAQPGAGGSSAGGSGAGAAGVAPASVAAAAAAGLGAGAKGKGLQAMLASMGELSDGSEYGQEFDMKAFMQKAKEGQHPQQQ